ncbi:MAG: hypothetical protein Fur003_6270 [Candidatus Dojkabacteria bacterium]
MAERFDLARQTQNYTIQLFLKISPLKKGAEVSQVKELQAVEFIDPEMLSQVSNSGNANSHLEELGATIKVSSADIDASIQEGFDSNTMMEGPWHFPISSAPGKLGNTVIIGHRFAEVPPSTNTFYNLDKIKVGDKIYVEQENGNFTYTVVQRKVVDKHDRSVLAPTNDHRITLITCHPLWTSDQRLVVIGVLDKIYRNI